MTDLRPDEGTPPAVTVAGDVLHSFYSWQIVGLGLLRDEPARRAFFQNAIDYAIQQHRANHLGVDLCRYRVALNRATARQTDGSTVPVLLVRVQLFIPPHRADFGGPL